MEVTEFNASFKRVIEELKDFEWNVNSVRKDEIFSDTKSLIEHNESGVAFENLCENIYEFSVQINQDFYELIEKIGDYLNKTSKYSTFEWKYLRELIKSE